MKKKLTVIAVIAIAVALLSVGTLAYFTHQTQAMNLVQAGKINIILNDQTMITHPDGSQEIVPFPAEGLTGVMPGETRSKVVSVTNSGQSAEAWIRVKLDCSITAAHTPGAQTPGVQTPGVRATATDLSLSYLKLGLVNIGEDWIEKDGWYYYNKPVQPRYTTADILDSVTLDINTPNEYQGCTIQVKVIAQAVQYANNSAGVDFAAKFPGGWPA